MGASTAGIRPGLSREEATEVVARLYGIRGTASPLPADRDQNFLIDAGDGRFVLKIHQSAEDPAFLECQDQVMERLVRGSLPYRFPRLVSTRDGARMARFEGVGSGGPADPEGGDAVHLVRMVHWVPGTPLARVASRTPGLEREVGRLLGTVDRTLEGFRHPAADRYFEWDVRRGGEVLDRYGSVVGEGGGAGTGGGREGEERLALVRHFRELFRARVEPRASKLRLSVIHGDGNDHNVLVDGEGAAGTSVVGLLDFGDLVLSWTVAEAAVAAAYTLLDRDDPLETLARVAAGYHREHPLTDPELGALFALTCMRLCVSVVQSARRAGERPSDPYLRVSEAPAWRVLARLAQADPDQMEERIREGCGA